MLVVPSAIVAVFLGQMAVIWVVVVDMECVGGEEVVSVEVVGVVDSVDEEDEEGVVQTDTGEAREVFMKGDLYVYCIV